MNDVGTLIIAEAIKEHACCSAAVSAVQWVIITVFHCNFHIPPSLSQWTPATPPLLSFPRIITACLSLLSFSSCCSFLCRPLGIHTFTCHLPHGAWIVLSTAWKLMAPEQCSDPIKVTSGLRLRTGIED